MAGNDPLPKRWPLVTPPMSRDNSNNTLAATNNTGFGIGSLRDALLVNAYAELNPGTGTYQVEKRPGINATPLFTAAAGNRLGRGVYYWNVPGAVASNPIFSIFASQVYKNGIAFGSAINSNFSFFQFTDIGSTPAQLLFNDGSSAYYTDGTTLKQITDPNFPSPFCKGMVYLDGTTYVMTPSRQIFGSANEDDVSTWDPLNVIIAQIEGDPGVGLAKQLVYVIALKAFSTEVFYDAGNTTGSPLTSLPAAKINYGCISMDTVQDMDGTLLWLASNKTGSPQVIRLDNLQPQVISTPSVERMLTACGPNYGYYSLALKVAGHRFYVLTCIDLLFSLAYDIDQGLWHKWSSVAGYFPYSSTTYDSNANKIVQHQFNSTLSYLDGDYIYPTDAGLIVPVDIYTPLFDGGVDRKKTLSIMRANTDVVPGSTLQIRCSDDDYNTWSNFRSMDLSKKRPILTNCGSFYRRALHLQHYAATPFRISSLDLDLALGTL